MVFGCACVCAYMHVYEHIHVFVSAPGYHTCIHRRSRPRSVQSKGLLIIILHTYFGFPQLSISACRLRERRRMSKNVYVPVVHDLELLRYVLRCAIERQL